MVSDDYETSYGNDNNQCSTFNSNNKQGAGGELIMNNVILEA